jgi:hypothetical protein
MAKVEIEKTDSRARPQPDGTGQPNPTQSGASGPSPTALNSPAKRDLLDAASKVMGMIVPIVIGWATYNLSNQQWQTQQRQYQNTIQEQDRTRVMDRLLALGSATSTDRLTAAKALRSYADLNRLDAGSLPGLLPYLKSECDEAVFSTEKDAALQAARNAKPPNSQEQQQLMAGLSAIERSSQCPPPAAVSATPPAVTTVVSAPPQYFDVGCGEEKAGVLHVPVPAQMQSNQKVVNVSATLANIDNLKSWSVIVTGHDESAADVHYSLIGLDRQLFGNCPGGGHGSVVTSFVLGPK